MRVKKRHFISLRIYIDYNYWIFQVQLTKKRSSSPSKDLVLLLIQMKQTSCCPSKSSEGWKLSSSWSIFLSFIHTVKWKVTRCKICKRYFWKGYWSVYLSKIPVNYYLNSQLTWHCLLLGMKVKMLRYRVCYFENNFFKLTLIHYHKAIWLPYYFQLFLDWYWCS